MPAGRIKKSTGSNYEIITGEGEIIHAVIKGKFRLEGTKNTNPLSVGDEVIFEKDNHGNAVIAELLPRHNYIIRKSNNLSHQSHIIASNADVVLLMVTLVSPRTSMGFADRVLLTAEAYQIPAVIIINKMDLYEAEEKPLLDEWRNIYSSIGYDFIEISAKNKTNIESVLSHIENKTALITGHSGTGKSLLLNCLNPALKLRTGEISSYSLKGKHTTTFAEMHCIKENTFVIDSPGIKDFGIIDMKKDEIGFYFREMRDVLSDCKFHNCQHINEPGCAVKNKVDKGEIPVSRYNSYLSIMYGEDIHH